MKDFNVYFQKSCRQLKWELERDKNGTEVPWLAGAYRKWMETKDGKATSANAYMSYLKALDREVLMMIGNRPEPEQGIVYTATYSEEDDFFYALKLFVTNGSFDDAEDTFNDFLGLIDEELNTAKVAKEETEVKNLRNWRSAFGNYKKFIMEWLIPTMKSYMGSNNAKQSLEMVQKADNSLYREEDFLEWVQEMGNELNTARSYISKIKGVNRKIFCKNKKGVDLLSLAAGCLCNGQESRAFDLLLRLESILTARIESGNDDEMPLSTLIDSRTAFRAYIRFLQQEAFQDVDGDDDSELQTDETVGVEASLKDVIRFDYDNLAFWFRRRLLTQDRFSESKEVFLPMYFLKRLFALSQDTCPGNGNYRWFNRWIDDSIAEITVLTDKGDYMLADIDGLEIHPQSRRVMVLLPDRQKATVWTETATGQRVPMQESALNTIHIDHTPPLARTLSDHAGQLPSLRRITEIIRECARRNHLAIKKENFAKIATELFLDFETSMEMESLIPSLKEELTLIRKASTLKLMSATYNLRKK